MKPGPRPMPQNLRILQGGRSAQPSRNPAKQPTPKVAVPPPPKYLTDRERRHWLEFTRRVRLLGVTCKADAGAIEIWAKARGRWLDAAAAVERFGLLVASGTEERPRMMRNPALTELHRCEATMLRIEVEFGLTPSSRTRVSTE